MPTIRLRINDKIYKPLMWFLQRFGKDEIQIIKEDSEFLSVKDYLQKELNDLDHNKAEFIDFDQLDQDLENTIRKYEA